MLTCCMTVPAAAAGRQPPDPDRHAAGARQLQSLLDGQARELWNFGVRCDGRRRNRNWGRCVVRRDAECRTRGPADDEHDEKGPGGEAPHGDILTPHDPARPCATPRDVGVTAA